MQRRHCIVGFAVLAVLAAAGARGEELSWREAAEAAALPRKAEDGAQRHGYTLYLLERHKDDPRPNMTGWCRVLAKGVDTIWDDKNANGRREPGENVPCPWHIYYELTADASVYALNAPPDKDGLNPEARKEYDRRSSMPGWKTAAIGNIGRVRPETNGGNVVYVETIHGPLYLKVNLRLSLSTKMWGLNPWYEEGDDRLKYEREHSAKRDEIVRQYKSCWTKAEPEAIELARAMLAQWDAWYGRKLANGPGPRGLFNRSSGKFLPLPSETPPGFSLAGEAPKDQNYWSIRFERLEEIPAQGSESNQRESETYVVEFFSFPEPGSSAVGTDKPADEAIRVVQRRLQDEVEGTRKSYTGEKKRFVPPVQLKLPGADEAIRCMAEYRTEPDGARATYYNEFDFVLVRHANVGFRVRGTRSIMGRPIPAGSPHPLRHTEALARVVLAKITGGGSQPGEAVSGSTVTLCAVPPAFWADGKSRCRIRLTCRDAGGQGLPGTFTLTAKGGGSLEAETLTLDAGGLAETDYTAGTEPGAVVITAAGPAGTRTVTVNTGGLAITPAKEGQWQVLADGKTALPLIVRAVGLDGKPLAGLRVTLRTEEKDLPQPGRLEPAEVQLDALGSAQAVYTPPLIAAGSGFRMGDVYVNATARVSAPSGTTLENSVRLTVGAGEGATLLVEKAGFKAVRVPISLASANSMLRGQVVARAPNGATFPLACATLRVAGADGKRPIGAGRSEAGGAFAFECVSSPLAGSGDATELPGPVEVPLDEALLAVLKGAGASLKELNGAGFEVGAAVRYLGGALQRLAQSDPQGEPGQRPEAIGGAAYRLGLLAVYIRLVHNRQLEDLDWFMESIDPVVDELVGLVGDITELEKKAKEKLGEKFDQLAWQRFRKTAAGRVLRMLNVWLRKNTKNLRALDKKLQEGIERGEKFNAAAGLPAEEGGEDGVTPAGLLHDLLNPLDALTPDLKLPDPDGGDSVDLKTWFLKTLKRSIRKPLENALRVQAQEELDAALKRLTYSGPGTDSLEDAKAAALAQFAAYQEAHLRLNIRNLDAELYRLDAKLFSDTVIKGVVIYLDARKTIAEAGVKALRSLTSEQFLKVQEAVTGGGEKVDKAAKFLDGAFRVYQGQAWLRDAGFAGDVIGALAGVLAP